VEPEETKVHKSPGVGREAETEEKKSKETASCDLTRIAPLFTFSLIIVPMRIFSNGGTGTVVVYAPETVETQTFSPAVMPFVLRPFIRPLVIIKPSVP